MKGFRVSNNFAIIFLSTRYVKGLVSIYVLMLIKQSYAHSLNDS